MITDAWSSYSCQPSAASLAMLKRVETRSSLSLMAPQTCKRS